MKYVCKDTEHDFDLISSCCLEAYLCFLASTESDSIRYTGLELCNGVILRFDCRGLRWGRQLKPLNT